MSDKEEWYKRLELLNQADDLLDSDDPEERKKGFALLLEDEAVTGSASLGVADCYLYGKGTEINYEEARRRFFAVLDPRTNEPLSPYCAALCLIRGDYGEEREKEGVRLLHIDAKRGLDKAQFELAKCYFLGIGCEVDREKGHHYLYLAGTKGNEEALRFLRPNGVLERFIFQDPAKEDVKKLKEAGNAGDIGACLKLSRIAYYEKEPNFEDFFYWTKKAYELGDIESSFILGVCYQEGLGVKANTKTAVRYFEEGAEKKDRQCLAVLGLCYLEGNGVKKNKKKGFAYLKEAAKMKFPPAEFEMFKCYKDGDGVERNDEKAFAYLKRAVSHYYYDGLLELGRCYLEGRGCEVNAVKAAKAFIDGSFLEVPYASLLAASCYIEGKGVKVDFDEAIALLHCEENNAYINKIDGAMVASHLLLRELGEEPYYPDPEGLPDFLDDLDIPDEETYHDA